jgi:hypothetical protein
VYTPSKPAEDEDDDGQEANEDERGSSEDPDEDDEDADAVSDAEETDVGEDEDDEGEDDEGEDDEEAEGDDGDDDDDPPRARRKEKSPEDFVVEPAPGRVGLLHLGRKSPPGSRGSASIPKEIRAQLGGSKRIEGTSTGDLYYAWKKASKRVLRFVAVHQGKLVETDVTTEDASLSASPSWDRRRILVPADGAGKLWSVDLPEGKATLVRDFGGGDTEGEVYSMAALASDRILAATSSALWLFSLPTGAPVVEARGDLDVRELEAVCEGRAAVLEVNEDKPLRVWGIHEDGMRVLAELDLHPETIEARDGRVLVKADDDSGWYEIVNIEDAWRAARDDTSGAQYPRVKLVKAPPSEEEGEDE